METNSPASLQSSPDSQTSKCPQTPFPISPSSKGKAPMEEPSAPFDFNYDNNEDDSYTQARSCGICLSEEGQAVRGCIDSCDHYFCFVCIVEWSKIESRCPLCKGRFCKIRRMRKDGSFIGDRDVLVPVRNQMYDPHRNVTSGPLDPYSNVSCAICANSTDENLLLLCDLCDTAVHTYCSGLGGTIPEGDWFCQECTQMKSEEMNITSPAPDHNTEKPSVQAPSSVFDIVREPGDPDPEVSRLFSLFPPQEQQQLSTASALSGLSCQNVGNAPGQGSRVCRKSETKVAVSSVRTLDQCRDAHKYIRDLRENWNALRSGSISFSSRKSESGATNNSRENQSSRSHGSNGSLHGNTPNECSYDVDRAWKMFDIAKSKKPQKSSNKSSASRNLSAKVSSLKDPKNMFLGASSTSVPSKTKSSMSIGLEMHQSFKRHDKCGSIGSGKHNNGVILGRDVCYTDMAAASSGKCTFSSKKTQKSVKNDVFHGRVIMLPQEKIGQASPRVYNEQGISSCTKSPAGLLTGASGSSCSDLDKKPAHLNSGRCYGQSIDTNSRLTNENNQSHKSAEKRTDSEDISGSRSKRIKVDNEAKSEIQSLVKLNLKLLSAGKKLEVDLFKDIARRSTHEILAACGLEPPRHNKLLIPKPICSHDDQNKKHSKLSRMPSSCRECFYAFVKEVVGSIVSDKISC
ncbi:hypothetical protein V2J09_019447 [Rumex salicifolius]